MPGGTTSRLDLDRAAVRHATALAIAVAALLLRLWRVGVQPLWFDEAMTVHIVHAADGLRYVHNTPPLYYLLLRAWTAVFGLEPAALRSFSAVAGAAFVWAAFHAARCAFGNRAALAAALFAAIAPIHVYYSQEARAYALLMLELLVAVWMLFRLARGVRRGPLALLAAASVAGLYTHFLAAITLALAFAMAVATAPSPVRRKLAAALGTVAAVAALAVLPWVVVWASHTPFAPRDMSWLANVWQQLPGAGALTSSIELLLVGGQQGRTPVTLKQFTWLEFPDGARIAALVCAGALVAWALVRWRRLGESRRRTTVQSLVLFAGPLAATWTASFVRPIHCPGRYDVIAFPGLVMLLAASIDVALAAPRAAARRLAGGLVLVLAAVLAAKDWCYLTARAEPDPAPVVAQVLQANVHSDDAVVLCGAAAVPVLAALYQQGFVRSGRTCRSPRSGVEFACVLLPRSLEEAPGTVTRYVRALQDASLAPELARVLPELDAAAIWLVLGDDLHPERPAAQPVRDRLFAVLRAAGYEIVSGQADLGVTHLRRRRPR